MKRLAISTVILSLSIMIVCGNKMQANPVDTNTVKTVAKNFLQKHDPSVKTVNMLRISDAAAANGFRNLYIVSKTTGDGFVVVSADNSVQPILGYSLSSAASNDMPINAKEMFQVFDEEIAYCIANNLQATEETAARWRELTRPQSGPNGLGSDVIALETLNGVPIVSPLLSTRWNQAPLYNNYCPWDYTYGERTVVGCVATAMAQIMKYWNYPTRGIGSNSYQYGSYGTLSANFGATTYDWANMPVALTANSTAAQIHAVATLSYHCGVAVEMMYNVSSQGGSGAYTNGSHPSAEYALVRFFGYKNTMASAYRYSYSDSQWDSLLRSEIDANRPVLECGFGNGGHAFVCDGYDNEGLFHYNWGWAGSYDGYFASNRLNPGGGGIGANSSHSYNNNQAIVYGIEPNNNNLVIRPENLNINPLGENRTISVRPAVDTHQWHATTAYPWITLSAIHGAGSSTITDITISVGPIPTDTPPPFGVSVIYQPALSLL